MHTPDSTIKQIFDLRFDVEYLFFKKFLTIYPSPDGINPTHIQTLMVLRFMGPSPMSSISQHLILEKGSFTPVANKLIQLGFVAKERSTLDKRIYHLSLTNKGLALANDYADAHHNFIKSVLGQLSDEKRAELLKSVEVTNSILATLKDGQENSCSS